MNYYKRVIVFDVETNGLFPKVKKGATPEETKQEPLPYILQLSFIVYDPKNKQVLQIGKSTPSEIVFTELIT